jgi:hypothetical protein
MLAPDRVEEPVDGDDAISLEQEHGEDRALLLAAERERPRLSAHLERAQNPKLRHVSVVTLFLGVE